MTLFNFGVAVWRLVVAAAVAASGISLSSCSKSPETRLTLARTIPIQSGTAVETSGLAPSRRADDMFWIHNDSGSQPVLQAIDARGLVRGNVRVLGVKNVDWEDIASFQLDGHSWLLIADVGDNNSGRRNAVVHVIAEPDPAALAPGRELAVSVAWTLPVRFPDKASDCEAVAVDERDELIYFLTKRGQPARLYTLPLRPSTDGSSPALKNVSSVRHLPQPDATQRVLPVPTGRYLGQPTAMAFAADGSGAAVLTYGNIAYFRRGPTQSWAHALARKPEIVVPHPLGQAEGICFSQDGRSLLVTGEQKEPALIFYTLRAEASP